MTLNFVIVNLLFYYLFFYHIFFLSYYINKYERVLIKLKMTIFFNFSKLRFFLLYDIYVYTLGSIATFVYDNGICTEIIHRSYMAFTIPG